jgi:hypothetical protein
MVKLALLIGIILVINASSGCFGSLGVISMESSTPNRAEIIITTTVYPGSTEYLVEFFDGKSKVNSTIKNYYNPATGKDLFQGDLSPIYQVIVGQLPDNPSAFQHPDSILNVLNAHGWKVVDDKTTGDSQNHKIVSEVRTIKIQRLNGS